MSITHLSFPISLLPPSMVIHYTQHRSQHQHFLYRLTTSTHVLFFYLYHSAISNFPLPLHRRESESFKTPEIHPLAPLFTTYQKPYDSNSATRVPKR